MKIPDPIWTTVYGDIYNKVMGRIFDVVSNHVSAQVSNRVLDQVKDCTKKMSNVTKDHIIKDQIWFQVRFKLIPGANGRK